MIAGKVETEEVTIHADENRHRGWLDERKHKQQCNVTLTWELHGS